MRDTAQGAGGAPGTEQYVPAVQESPRVGQAVLLQQATVVLNDAMGLPGQLSLQRKKNTLIPHTRSI